MAYVVKKKDKDLENGQDQVSLSNVVTPESDSAGGGQVKKKAKANYVSGDQYAKANKPQVTKWGEELAADVDETVTTGLDSVSSSEDTYATGQEDQIISDDPDLITTVLADPTDLSTGDTATVKRLLAGEYTPGTPEYDEAIKIQAGIETLGELYKSEEGIASTIEAEGGRYTAGMRKFDAMMLRQKPETAALLEGQGEKAAAISGAIDESVISAAALDDLIAAENAAIGEKNRKLFGDAITTNEAERDRLLKDKAVTTFAKQTQERVKTMADLTPQELSLLGLTPEQYDNWRNTVTTNKATNEATTAIALGELDSQINALSDAIGLADVAGSVISPPAWEAELAALTLTRDKFANKGELTQEELQLIKMSQAQYDDYRNRPTFSQMQYNELQANDPSKFADVESKYAALTALMGAEGAAVPDYSTLDTLSGYNFGDVVQYPKEILDMLAWEQGGDAYNPIFDSVQQYTQPLDEVVEPIIQPEEVAAPKKIPIKINTGY